MSDSAPPTPRNPSGSTDISQARAAWCAVMCARATIAACAIDPGRSWPKACERRRLFDLARAAADLFRRFECWQTSRRDMRDRSSDSRAYDALVADAAAIGISPY